MTMDTKWFQGQSVQEGDNTASNPQHDLVKLKMRDGRVVQATRQNANLIIERGDATLIEGPATAIDFDGNTVTIE